MRRERVQSVLDVHGARCVDDEDVASAGARVVQRLRVCERSMFSFTGAAGRRPGELEQSQRAADHHLRVVGRAMSTLLSTTTSRTNASSKKQGAVVEKKTHTDKAVKAVVELLREVRAVAGNWVERLIM